MSIFTSQNGSTVLVNTNDYLDMHQLREGIQPNQLQHQSATSGKVLFSGVSCWILRWSKYQPNLEARDCRTSIRLPHLDGKQAANWIRERQVSRQNSIRPSHSVAAQKRASAGRIAIGSSLREQILLQSRPFAGGHGQRKFTGFDFKQHGGSALQKARLPEMWRAIQRLFYRDQILQAVQEGS